MHRILQYLQKQGKTSSCFDKIPSSRLKLIIVIPAYKEPNIEPTIRSLFECDPTEFDVELLVFVNGFKSDTSKDYELNQNCLETLSKLQSHYSIPERKLLVMSRIDLEPKKGGVGMARKTLMDEAAFRFSLIGYSDGIIANLDADCLVASNYLIAIREFHASSPQFHACSIYYEHRFLNPKNKEAIISYESHLRYYIGMQKLIGLPFAFQTVGSSMTSKVRAYTAVGGMNTRKAGEDFYFLHKFIKNNTCGVLSTTTVFPSDRISDRVPFGTGRAILDNLGGKTIDTYHPKSFQELAFLLKKIPEMYTSGVLREDNLNSELLYFLKQQQFHEKCNEIIANTSSYSAFMKRFHQYFDAFFLMKYLHFMRDRVFPNVSIENAIQYYFKELGLEHKENSWENLHRLRLYDKTES